LKDWPLVRFFKVTDQIPGRVSLRSAWMRSPAATGSETATLGAGMASHQAE